MSDTDLQKIVPDNDQTLARREHLDALRQLVGNVYPNKFQRSNVTDSASGEDTITSVVDKFKTFEPQVAEGERPSPEALEAANVALNNIHVRIAGRIASPPRVMGKAAFVHLSDGVARLQVYVRKADVRAIHNDTGAPITAEGSGWDFFGLLDHGDFIGAEGYLFVTKTGELSVHVQTLQFLTKALLPMPDKVHGIHDAEIRQRQRYADLIAGSLKLEREENDLTPREVFELRSKVIRGMRRFLDEHDFVEVETPMLTPLATGAAARAFETHHNALDIKLYARIAPELYLKRLVVGGFEKVYELNRNFRNEGISTKHNPEFTMLEFYMAYADVNQMMEFCEELLRKVVTSVSESGIIRYGEHEDPINFSKPFDRFTMKEAILHYGTKYPMASIIAPSIISEEFLNDRVQVHTLAAEQRIQSREMYRELKGQSVQSQTRKILKQIDETQYAEDIVYLFELIAEPQLIQPTFITDFPKAASPLSKASPSDPSIAERFEYFVGGLESANGFSELNDPAEQYQRFKDQVTQRERGDEEAMVMDEDYIRALSYGMPPAAGIGIGIDRLVMLLANKQSIRDVILFPHMRPERRGEGDSE